MAFNDIELTKDLKKIIEKYGITNKPEKCCTFENIKISFEQFTEIIELNKICKKD